MKTSRIGWGLACALLTLTAYVVWDNWADAWTTSASTTASQVPHETARPVDNNAQIERGQYLARAGVPSETRDLLQHQLLTLLPHQQPLQPLQLSSNCLKTPSA